MRKMIDDLKRLFDYFGKEREGKISRNRIVFYLAVFFISLIVNRFIFSQYISDNLRVPLSQSRLLFINSNNPYGENVQNHILGLADEEGWDIDEMSVDFEEPVYDLIIYFPFALIGNYQWAGSLFLTVNQICIFLIIGMLFQLLEWNANNLSMTVIYLACAASVFFIGNLLNITVTIIQLCLIVASIYFDQKKRSTLSGVFLGLSFIEPLNLFIFHAIILIIFFTREKYKILIWTFITITLLTIFSYIFVSDWIMEWLKTLFLTPRKFPFLSYTEAIKTRYTFEASRLLNGIPIILTTWMMLEIRRTPKDNKREWIWLLSLGAIFNYYIMIQSRNSASVLFIIPLIFLFIVWWEKVNRWGKIALVLVLFILTLGLSVLHFSGLKSLNNIEMEIILLIMSIIFIFNIYWSRRWIIDPYMIND